MAAEPARRIENFGRRLDTCETNGALRLSHRVTPREARPVRPQVELVEELVPDLVGRRLRYAATRANSGMIRSPYAASVSSWPCVIK